MVKRKDPDFQGRFQKNEAAESFLVDLNEQVRSLNDQYLDNGPPAYPSVFVLGVPRSGTTLLTQVLARTFDLGYVSNLMAAFWRAPLVGLRLQQKLVETDIAADFHSEFGRTRGISGIHEFGYFWAEMLCYNDLHNSAAARTGTVDWNSLRQILASIVNSAQRPFIYKNVLLNWHANELNENIDKAVFVVIRRDLAETTLSLMRAREAMLGTREKWVSAKPLVYPQLADRDPLEQVAGQVLALQQELDHEVAGLSAERVLQIDFEDFCGQPNGYFDSLRSIFAGFGWQSGQPATEISPFTYRSAAESERTAAANALETMRELLDFPAA